MGLGMGSEREGCCDKAGGSKAKIRERGVEGGRKEGIKRRKG